MRSLCLSPCFFLYPKLTTLFFDSPQRGLRGNLQTRLGQEVLLPGSCALSRALEARLTSRASSLPSSARRSLLLGPFVQVHHSRYERKEDLLSRCEPDNLTLLPSTLTSFFFVQSLNFLKLRTSAFRRLTLSLVLGGRTTTSRRVQQRASLARIEADPSLDFRPLRTYLLARPCTPNPISPPSRASSPTRRSSSLLRRRPTRPSARTSSGSGSCSCTRATTCPGFRRSSSWRLWHCVESSQCFIGRRRCVRSREFF